MMMVVVVPLDGLVGDVIIDHWEDRHDGDWDGGLEHLYKDDHDQDDQDGDQDDQDGDQDDDLEHLGKGSQHWFQLSSVHQPLSRTRNNHISFLMMKISAFFEKGT